MVAKILRNNWIRNIKKIPVSYLVLFIKKIWHSLAIIEGRGGGGASIRSSFILPFKITWNTQRHSLLRDYYRNKVVNSFLAVQNLKMALEKSNILYHIG